MLTYNTIYSYSILFSCNIIVYQYTKIWKEKKKKKKIKKKEKESVKHYRRKRIIRKRK